MRDIPWGPHHPDYYDTAEEFFGEVPATDLVRWSGVQYWTHEEGVALSFGFDPRVVTADRLSNHDEHPFAAEFDRRMDLAQRAVVAGQLSDLPSPKQFIRWAERIEISFPIDLALMVKSAAGVTKSTTSSPSGLKTLINKLSRLALGMTQEMYGFNPEIPSEEGYEDILADLQSVGIPSDLQSIKRCLKVPNDLYEDLPEVRETLGNVVLGLAICHFEHDPKSSRSKAPSQIAEALKKHGCPVTEDTIRERLKEAATNLGMAQRI
jgi:hypothetical protein